MNNSPFCHTGPGQAFAVLGGDLEPAPETCEEISKIEISPLAETARIGHF